MTIHTTTGQSAHLCQSDDIVPPLILASQRAFERDVSELLTRHAGKWAAYHGDEFVGIAATKTELYERCLNQGLKRDEFVVRGIEPLVDDCDTAFGFSP